MNTAILICMLHSCQVYKRRDRDKVENVINACKILRTTPTFGRLCTGTLTKHRDIPDWNLLVPHLHLCNRAGFRDNAAKSGKLGHNRDIGPNSGTVPAKPGHLATVMLTHPQISILNWLYLISDVHCYSTVDQCLHCFYFTPRSSIMEGSVTTL